MPARAAGLFDEVVSGIEYDSPDTLKEQRSARYFYVPEFFYR
jgi:hypothetical protein